MPFWNTLSPLDIVPPLPSKTSFQEVSIPCIKSFQEALNALILEKFCFLNASN